MAAVSDAVPVRPEQRLNYEQRCGERALRYAIGEPAVASEPLRLMMQLGEALRLPLRVLYSGELVPARPAGWDGRVGSQGRSWVAVSGGMGSVHVVVYVILDAVVYGRLGGFACPCRTRW